MLKKICGLFLGLVVLAGSTCVTPTHASSASSVIITSIQAGVSGDAKQELVILYNQSPVPVDITNWCVENKSLVLFACFSYSGESNQIVTAVLPPYGYATIASKNFAEGEATSESYYSIAYTVTSQSSGSIVGGADTIRLLDASGNVVDSFSWTTSLAAGKVWARSLLTSSPDQYGVTGLSADWSIQSPGGQPFNTVVVTYTAVTQPPVEIDPEFPVDVPNANSLLNPYITELLPNPKGSDAGIEFIELYNPNPTDAVALADMFLRVGYDTPKWYAFPDDATIPPGSFAAFYSSELGFSLTNTKAKVQLYRGELPIGDAVEYATAKDDQAWALIAGAWQYTTIPTPGANNQSTPIKATSTVKATTTPKPCASNQFRNPATGRCKLIASVAAKKPCAANQFRNPVTGRCKLISAATSTLTPCKENQERNPETNRCRGITKMSDAGHKVSGVETGANQTKWYYWLAIAGAVLLILGYGVWEWREELRMFAGRINKKLRSLFHRKTGLY